MIAIFLSPVKICLLSSRSLYSVHTQHLLLDVAQAPQTESRTFLSNCSSPFHHFIKWHHHFPGSSSHMPAIISFLFLLQYNLFEIKLRELKCLDRWALTNIHPHCHHSMKIYFSLSEKLPHTPLLVILTLSLPPLAESNTFLTASYLLAFPVFNLLINGTIRCTLLVSDFFCSAYLWNLSMLYI